MMDAAVEKNGEDSRGSRALGLRLSPARVHSVAHTHQREALVQDLASRRAVFPATVEHIPSLEARPHPSSGLDSKTPWEEWPHGSRHKTRP